MNGADAVSGAWMIKEAGGVRAAHFIGMGLSEFRQGVRSAVYGLWAGKLTTFSAADTLMLAVERAFRRAWIEGAQMAGIAESELTADEREALRAVTSDQYRFVGAFVRAIKEGSKANGGLLRDQMRRGELWLMRYAQVRDLARTLAKADQKLIWQVNAVESCPDCLDLAGRVHRSSVWQAAGCLPRAPRLACMQSAHGVPVCRCELLPTGARAWPGRPPGKGA